MALATGLSRKCDTIEASIVERKGGTGEENICAGHY